MEDELNEELQFHLDRETERRGDAARIRFGGVEQIKEACRDERGTGAVDRARQDLRYAWRMFIRQPGFTAAVVLTLGLGIGGATTMFGIVDGILLEPLPYPEADRLVRIGRSFGGIRVGAVSAVDHESLSARSRTLSGIALARTADVDLRADGSPTRVKAATVSASYFSLLGGTAARGRLFAADDDRPGVAPIAIVSETTGVRLHDSILINDQPHTVIGVMPRRFHGPEALSQDDVDVWLPLGRLQLSPDPDEASFTALASMREGVVLPAVSAEVAGIAGSPNYFWIAPLHDETVGDAGAGLWLLFGAVSLLLVLACVNVAHLFLVRAADRARELAVRASMGAGRGRIAGQLVTETVCFSLAGGVLGALIAYGAIEAVRQAAPADLPRLGDLRVDLQVLLFAFGIASLAGSLFGIAPALSIRRSDLAGVLRGARAATMSRSHVMSRHVLVVLQTAIAMMLVVGAALLGNSVFRLSRVNPGFDPSNVVWIDVSLPERSYAGAAPKIAFFDDLLARARAVPGVQSVSVIQGRPLGGGNSLTTVAAEGQLPASGQEPARVPVHVVASGYFDTVRIRLLDGRDFESGDRLTSPRVAIVSRAFADQFWPGERAVGKQFWLGRVAADAPLTEVVGVADDVRQYGIATAPVPMVYRPLAQAPRGAATLVARHDGHSAAGAIERLRSAVWTIDSALPLDRADTMHAAVSRSIREPRFRALALSAFGVVACAIACVGLYGSLAWLVRTRRREIGIRVALGARAGSITGIVLRRGLSLAGAGIALGLTAAFAATGLLGSLVFGVSPTDPTTFVAAALAMLAVAFGASLLPARQASSISAVEILGD
jgi:putative ABC transport system permease protein